MKFSFLSSFLIFFSCFYVIYGGRFTPKIKKIETKKEILPKLNLDLLPSFEEILTELELSHRKNQLIKMGIVETRHLLRLKNMDYQMMLIEWDGDDVDQEIVKLKEKSGVLLKMATVIEVEETVVDTERSKLRTGRLYFPSFVQSFEYISASFGGIPPLGSLSVYIPDNFDGCSPPSSDELSSYQNKLVVIGRGNCTFLQKAHNAKAAGVKVLAIINTEDKVEALASGLGIDPNITAEMVTPLQHFPIISLANTSFPSLRVAYDRIPNLQGAIIPLKCQAGGQCRPVTEEEKGLQSEIPWGELTVSLSSDSSSPLIRSQFLTSTFGGVLPSHVVLYDLSQLIQQLSQTAPSLSLNDTACSALPSELVDTLNSISLSSSESIGLMVRRGGCRFDEKAYQVQLLSSSLSVPISLVLLYDSKDVPLQRLGGVYPLEGYISLPAIMIPYHTARLIQSSLSSSSSSSPVTVRGAVRGSSESHVFNQWIEIALMEWEEKPINKLLQLEGMKRKYSDDKNRIETDRTGTETDVEEDDLLAWLSREKTRVEKMIETVKDEL